MLGKIFPRRYHIVVIVQRSSTNSTRTRFEYVRHTALSLCRVALHDIQTAQLSYPPCIYPAVCLVVFVFVLCVLLAERRGRLFGVGQTLGSATWLWDEVIHIQQEHEAVLQGVLALLFT